MPRRSPQANRLQESFGRAIRQERHRQELTQQELAELLGLHPTDVSSIEGGRRNPTLETMKRISNALGLSLYELLKAAEELERKE